jgi:ubiquinone/menaquinone biosynthesis C-methylase UbiE
MRNRDLFVRMAQWGKSVFTLNRDREYAALKRMLYVKPTDVVLDIGCGDGFWTSRMAQHCAHIIGLEPNPKTLDYARRFHALPNTTYVCGIAESLPFTNEAFDKVLSVSCLEHFADPWRGLDEIARVVRPNGRVALSVDSLLPENSPPSFREWHKRRHFVTHYFSQGTLIEALQSSGFHHDDQLVVHLFRSRLAARLRELFIRRPYMWLPLFPAFYLSVRLSDQAFNDMHGQVIVVSASR